MIPVIEHDPEKACPRTTIRGWKPVFGKDHAPIKHLDSDPIQFDRITVWPAICAGRRQSVNLAPPVCAERTSDRVLAGPFARECCQTTMSNGPYPVAWMSGAISGYDRRAFMPLPDFASLIRATKKARKRNAGRRGSPRPAHIRRAGRATEKAACAALPLRARSPAGVPPRHLRGRPNATAQLQFTHFLGRN